MNKYFSNGNSKVGNMLIWNKLAGNGIINGIKGTCGNCCEGCYNAENPMKSPCYVFKSYRQYGDSVINSHIDRTVAMRMGVVQTFKGIDAELKEHKKIKPVRIHASGELETLSELLGWVYVARNNPSFPFCIYTKNYALIDKYFQMYLNLPANFTILISIWHNEGLECYNKYKNKANIKAFVYDDGYAYDLKPTCTCPAYKNGKRGNKITCDKCRLCITHNETPKIIFCKEH